MHGSFATLALLGAWLAAESQVVAPKDPLLMASGTYQRGNGLSFNQTLVITRERYTLGTYDDSPLDNAPAEVGRTTVEAGALVLIPAIGNPSTPLLIVPWGGRLYLVEKSRLGEFCSAVKAGSEPRKQAWGQWFLRESDWNTEVPPGNRPVPCRNRP